MGAADPDRPSRVGVESVGGPAIGLVASGRHRGGTQTSEKLTLGTDVELAEHGRQVVTDGALAQMQVLGDGADPVTQRET